MASREYRELIASIAEPVVSPDDSWREAREKLNALHGHPIQSSTEVAPVELGGVPCAWITTPVADRTRALLFCHGGAFVAASGNGYHFYAEMLSSFCNATVLLVDYRLAPEHPYPAALDDCADAYRGLVESAQSPKRVALIGDSCGGGLALATLLRARAAGLPMPAAAVTLGGWFDLEASQVPTIEQSDQTSDPFAHPQFTRARGRDYVGPNGDLRHPMVSPIHADPSGFPPLLLQVGQVDLTRGDAARLADTANRCGVDVTLDVHPEMVHGFQGLASAGIPEAVAALERVGAFVRHHIPTA